MQSCVLCSFVRCGTSNQIEEKKRKKKPILLEWVVNPKSIRSLSENISHIGRNFRKRLSKIGIWGGISLYLDTVLLRINTGGVHLIFDILGGAFSQGRRLHEGGVYYKIQRELQFYISTSMISSLLLSEKRHYIVCKPHNTPIHVLVQRVEEEQFK